MKTIHRPLAILMSLSAVNGVVMANNHVEGVREVSIVVVDEKGNAIPDVDVYVGNNRTNYKSDANGKVSLKGNGNELVTISEKGYEEKVLSLNEAADKSLVVLENSELFNSSEDNIELPYWNMQKANSTGDYIVITGEELERYPSSDLRLAFSGLVTGLSITETDGATGISSEIHKDRNRANEYMRGNMPIYLIDGVQVDIAETPLDPQEIETVTFIKDVLAKTMYGPRAANGVISIKTKRGKTDARQLRVNMEAGLSVVDRFPNWTEGADYARLNNMARQNSGMDPIYSDEAIAGYSKNDPYDLKYPSTNFKDMMFKDTKSYQRVNLSSTGGNDFVKYFAYLGYTGEGDNFKIGETANYNRLNARANMDMKINDFISVDLGLFAGLSIRKSPNYQYDTFDYFDFDRALDQATSVSPIAFPIYVPIESEDKDILNYGVSNTFNYNPIGALASSGYYTEKGRSGRANIGLNIDLNHIIKGISLRTFMDISSYNQTRIGKYERYSAYTMTPSDDAEGGYEYTHVQTPITASGESKMRDYYFLRYSGYQSIDYKNVFNGKHDVKASAILFLSHLARQGVEQPLREMNANFMAGYTYDKKYSIQGAVSYAGSQELISGERFRAFPSFGASWVISEENFMDDVNFIDFLKLRAEWGVLGYLSSSPTSSQYENKWQTGDGSQFGPNSSNTWMGGGSRWTPKYTFYNKWKNPDLDWETRKEFSVGIDAMLFNKSLSVSVNYYRSLHDGIWVRPTNLYPSMVGLLEVPYMNYNKTLYQGGEIAARYKGQVGDFSYMIGGSFSMPRTERIRYDEPNYKWDYQYHEGKPTDAIFGLVYDGRYASDEEANSVNQLFDVELHEGDFKYKDLNGDGVIDDNDKTQIGNSSPKYIYTLNLGFKYKDFEVTIIGDGKAGFDIQKTNRYFQNGWGDNNYSEYVLNNVGGDYPRLTYYKVNNNFQMSDFWLMKGTYFKIQNVELAYTLRLPFFESMGLQKMRIFARGANLLTISGVKDVDPESVNSGVTTYPLNRTFTAGFNLTF